MVSDTETTETFSNSVPRTPRKRTLSSRSLHNINNVVSDLERFHRRTISTSDMRHSRSGYLPLTGDDDDREGRTNTISNMETIIHLMKGNIGIGVLTMPIALSNAGLVGGVLGMVFVATVTIHCMHTLVIAAQKLVRSRGVTFLDYADTAEAAFECAGGRWSDYSVHIRRLLNIFLCMSQIGSNAVYILFVAQNILPIIETHFAPGWNYRIYIAILLLPVILICSIRNLKYLSPCSVLANILEFVGLGIIFYYIFESPLPSSDSVPWFTSVDKFPIFFGTAIFAFEGISVVLPIENQMSKPKDMLGWAGVLNFSMVSIACLYIGMGFFGYLRYGSATEASITLNLPTGSPLAQIALCMFSVAIFFSYALQFYVVMDIIGPNILRPRVSDQMFPYVEQATRVLLNVLTLGMAATVPWLDLLVSLLGAVKMSTLSLMAPALIDSAAHWNSDSRPVFVYRCIKNIIIFTIGFLACIMGTYISTKDIINNFRNQDDY